MRMAYHRRLRRMSAAEFASPVLHNDPEAQLEQLADALAAGNLPSQELARVRALVAQAEQADTVSPVGRYRMAQLLGHCGAMSGAVEDVARAHDLALRAMAQHRPARRLAAELYDQQRVLSGLAQKFGTQPVASDELMGSSRPWVDPATTDSERAKWDLPSLEQLTAAHRAAVSNSGSKGDNYSGDTP